MSGTSIAVFGASGATGKAFIAVATSAGIPLRLHYRSAPDDDAPPLGTVIVGSLADQTAVREVLRGTSAAVVLLGPRMGSSDVFCAPATKTIVAAMRHQQGGRLLCVTGAMLGSVPSNVSMTMRAVAMAWRKFRSEAQADDREEQERIVRSSRLDWTLVKPPRLTNDEGEESIRADTGLDVGLRSAISRRSVAKFLLDEIVTPRFIGQTVYVTGVREHA